MATLTLASTMAGLPSARQALRALVLVAVVDHGAHAYDNGVSRLPPMGWNTWCTYGDCAQSFEP